MAAICMLLNNAFLSDVRVHKEATYLIGKGHEVTILALDRKNEALDRPEEIVDGIRVIRLYCRHPGTSRRMDRYPLLKKFKKLVYASWFLKFVKEAKRHLRTHPYDYLHCHDWHDIIAGYLARAKGCPMVFDMHEYYEDQLSRNPVSRRVFRCIINFFQSRSRYIVYVHDVQTTTMREKNKAKLVLLPNYPDGARLKPVTHTPSERLRIAYVGYVRGNILWYRNLLDACRGKDVRLTIHGTGALYEPVKGLSEGMDNVAVTGAYRLQEEFETIYSNMDLLWIFPEEGAPWIQPTKFFEALRSGTPYVAHTGTYLEAFARENGVGFSVDMTDPQSVKDGIDGWLRDPAAVYRARERTKALVADYDWNAVVVNLDRIYEKGGPYE